MGSAGERPHCQAIPQSMDENQLPTRLIFFSVPIPLQVWIYKIEMSEQEGSLFLSKTKLFHKSFLISFISFHQEPSLLVSLSIQVLERQLLYHPSPAFTVKIPP